MDHFNKATKPLYKAELASPTTLRAVEAFTPLTEFADTLAYYEDTTREAMQTVYLLIDDQTPEDAPIDPALTSAYQALSTAAQMLFEARIHMYRYVNVLTNAQRAAAAVEDLPASVQSTDADDK